MDKNVNQKFCLSLCLHQWCIFILAHVFLIFLKDHFSKKISQQNVCQEKRKQHCSTSNITYQCVTKTWKLVGSYEYDLRVSIWLVLVDQHSTGYSHPLILLKGLKHRIGISGSDLNTILYLTCMAVLHFPC